MNTVTLDNALYDDVANIARWSNIVSMTLLEQDYSW